MIAYELWNPQVKVDSAAIETAKQMIEDYLIKKQAGEGRGENLILIGFMGAGKTSVGEHFAARYQMPLIDTDKEIEAAAGMAYPTYLPTRERKPSGVWRQVYWRNCWSRGAGR